MALRFWTFFGFFNYMPNGLGKKNRGFRSVIQKAPAGEFILALWDWEGGVVGKLLIGAIAVICLLIYFHFSNRQPSNTASTTNSSNSPSTQIIQSPGAAVNNNYGSVSFNNNGYAIYQTGTNNSILTIVTNSPNHSEIELPTNAPDFEVYINDSTNPLKEATLKEAPIIRLGEDRKINIRIVNVGGTTARNVHLNLLSALDSTNVICPGWREGKGYYDLSGNPIRGMTTWQMEPFTIPNGRYFYTCPPFQISTSLPLPIFTKSELEERAYIFIGAWTNYPPNAEFPLPLSIHIYSEDPPSAEKECEVFITY